MILSVFQFFLVFGILGPPYCGIGATIRIGREILCLPYAGFFLSTLNLLAYEAICTYIQTNSNHELTKTAAPFKMSPNVQNEVG